MYVQFEPAVQVFLEAEEGEAAEGDVSEFQFQGEREECAVDAGQDAAEATGYLFLLFGGEAGAVLIVEPVTVDNVEPSVFFVLADDGGGAGQVSSFGLGGECAFHAEVGFEAVEAPKGDLPGDGLGVLPIVVDSVGEDDLAGMEVMEVGGVLVAVGGSRVVVGVLLVQAAANEIEPVDLPA